MAASKPLRDLAQGLARLGIASLRYDKRTHAHPRSLDPLTVTVEQEVIADAALAVGALARAPRVRRDAVFIVGHSLGALLAPEIAARARCVRGMVLLAPPGRPLPTIVVDQLRYLGALPAEQIEAIARQADELVRGIYRKDTTFLGISMPYWRDLATRAPARKARALDMPTAILRGERDYQTTDADLEVWRRALAGGARTQVHTLPGLNHLFIRGEGRPGPAEYARPGRVADEVLDLIADLVKRAMKGAAPPGC